MSGKGKSKAISVYITPKVQVILDQYVKASGYGSISRTVEELILAYDSIYSVVINLFAESDLEALYENKEMMSFILWNLLQNLKLGKGTPIEQYVNNKLIEAYQKKIDEA